jgi:hypothetical protein
VVRVEGKAFSSQWLVTCELTVTLLAKMTRSERDWNLGKHEKTVCEQRGPALYKATCN